MQHCQRLSGGRAAPVAHLRREAVGSHDQGRTMNREEKFEAWQRGYERTQVRLWELALIMVAK